MNIIKKLFSIQKVETFQVQTEEELHGKVEEVVGKVLQDQRVQLNFQSSKNPNFSEIVKFGYREGDSFKGADLNVKFIFNPSSLPKSSKKSSNVFYDVRESIVAVIQEPVSIKRMSSSSSKHEVQGAEVDVLADHPQIAEKGSVEFFKRVQKYSKGSKDRLLTPETSERIQGLVTSKLKEISSIVPPKEFGEEILGKLRGLLFF